MSCEKPEDVMPRKPRHDRGKTCHKCKTQPGQLIVRHFVYCKDCFFAHVHSKFRRQMPAREAYCQPEQEPSLSVAFSGGLGASVLLDLVARTYRREGARKPVWSPITAYYVETCAAYDGVPDAVEHVKEVVNGYRGIELVVLRLEDAFDTQTPLLALSLADERLPLSSSSSATPTDALRAHLAALPTPTARLQAISNLTYALVLRAAPSHAPILFGTHLTALAVSLISGVAHGAGYNLTPPARIVRPLCEISAKECAAYAHWRALRPLRSRGPPGMDSVLGITRDFIVRLDRDFPSTVSAVARTCAKVVPKRDSSSSAGAPLTCALCERPAQHGVLEWKTRTAIRSFSSDSEQDKTEGTAVAEELCYACHTMLTSRARVRGPSDVEQVLPVPSWTSSTIRARMRESVKDFILDDED
ncbi:hypothetical protein EXIGLDRAFT_759644 [Exidia glandulosa HHB12029]|uniref:Cytoplasmic tRNA 2-thiolation protein 2 n=1 Tax=Exidia glandulosa HHB12029 TaxID=1314781 RepID=A0A165Q161_EXIGL|nr:hypothetical protein EXIGLDRAFT_759644 [Exidia glandulosa HHB12029]